MTRAPLLLLLLAACAGAEPPPRPAPAATPASAAPTDVAPPPPPPSASTAEEFDTTTEEERAAAVAAPADAAGEARLGTTIASLGPPADPGLWLDTPLVTEAVQGRVEYPGAGTSVALELRPSGGEAGSGSEISLAAMRLLGAPLTGLPELVVYGPGSGA